MSHAEITMKSGAVVMFDCISLSFTQKRHPLGDIDISLKWELSDEAQRRPVYINLVEVAAAIFVDTSSEVTT